MTDFLAEALARARIEEEARSMTTPIEVLRPLALARPAHRSLLESIRECSGRVPILAEWKRAGNGSGAVALLASLEDLSRAREASPLPIVRRDLALSAYGVYESAAGGADAFVLTAAAGPLYEVEECISASIETGLEVLFEVSDEDDLRKARHLEPAIVLVSARDPRTLGLDPERHARLRALVPATSLAVAAGGLRIPEDIERLRALGYAAVVV